MKNLQKILLWTVAVLFCSCNSKEQSQNIILKYPFRLKDGNININHSNDKKVLNEAYQIASKEQNDSLKNKMLLEISYQYLKNKDSTRSFSINKKARKLSVASKDSLNLAMAYWDLGNYYHGNNMEDSAYFYYNGAQKLYAILGNEFNSGRLLLNMAIIQKNVKDYTGSEITTVKAISLLKPLKKNKQLYAAYNNLGIVFDELEEYDKALIYYDKALNYLDKSDKNELFPSLWNNIGVVYLDKKKFSEAAQYFKKALEYNQGLRDSDPKIYAMILDNQAHTRFLLNDTTGVYKQFLKALEIRKDLGLETGISINQLHLSEYLLQIKDTSNAIKYALAAKDIASKSQNTRDLLSSLQLLSNAVSDSALNYSKQFIKINDSLQKQERATRNKFARIRFETDEYISETERLNQRILRISLIALGILLIFVLLYIIKDQKSRNRLIEQRQKANQEIYNLVLEQQKVFEEGREKEKQDISRELHDGILGRLFGVRLSLDALNEKNNIEGQTKRSEYIGEIQNIAEEIRLVSHKLNKASFNSVNFKTVLQELIEKQNTGEIRFQLKVNNSVDIENIENEVKINFYRIIQEAINNIQKHSRATEATIQIRNVKKLLILSIKDNGIGLNNIKSKKGIGLKNIAFRAKNINGKISFNNNARDGTHIIVALKYSDSDDK